ncbi:MAG: hypothetical protein B0A82_10095 [Alkalinema sp. CACIAM 70d]|nr:MAG: hypothetical protein B0A82_10095 [Alkalinema sp. CACIAM 70d]
MNSRQIESWALRIIDCVKSGQPNEDFLVELKRDWISADKAARRIAGHANAARGEQILWLIGIDEKSGPLGVDANELANWYRQVESYFSELAPKMTPLNIPVDGVVIVALLFETDRAPFLVRNPAYGAQKGECIELEIPWRANTSIRSARRSDIIKLLTPLEVLPTPELLDIQLKLTRQGKDSFGNHHDEKCELFAELYITPSDKNRVVIPFHRCHIDFDIPDSISFTSSEVRLYPTPSLDPYLIFDRTRNREPSSLTIQSTAYEIIIHGPGKISLQATALIPTSLNFPENPRVNVSIYLKPANADRPVVLMKSLVDLEVR